MSRSKVLIADDHTLVAELCRSLLQTEFDVVGTVRDGRALVRAAAALRPEVIIADVGMPLLNGLDAVEQIKRSMPAVRIIFLTMNNSTELAAEAFRRGASAFLLKTCASRELLIAIRNVLRGQTYLSPSIIRDKVEFLLRRNHPMEDEGDRLTARQREVLQLLAEGKSMKEVASVLNLTVRTVAFHKYRMMEVLNLRSTAELVQYAIRNHILMA